MAKKQTAGKRVLGFDYLVEVDLGVDLYGNGSKKEIPALEHGRFNKVREYVEENAIDLGDQSKTSVGYMVVENVVGQVHHTVPHQTVTGRASTFLLASPEYTTVKFIYGVDKGPDQMFVARGIFDVEWFLAHTKSPFYASLMLDTRLVIETLSADEIALSRLSDLVRESMVEDSLSEIDMYLVEEESILAYKMESAREHISDRQGDECRVALARYLVKPQEARANCRNDHIMPILVLGRKYGLERVISRATEVLEGRDKT